MKRFNKNAIKRGQSRTCLNYAECKHFGRSQTKAMYALLIAVVAMIGITIYASCSADEDYDYYSGNELTTRAEREMGRGAENPVFEWYVIDSGNKTTSQTVYFDTLCLEIEANISWEENKVDANLAYVHCSLNIKNNEMVSFNNNNESPLYELSYQYNGNSKNLHPTFSELTVLESSVKCYQIQYNSDGQEISRTQIGLPQNLSFTVDITNSVSYCTLYD